MKSMMLKIIFVSLVALGLNGCYTIIWTPDDQFPTEENYYEIPYYGDAYYGDYYYFYDYPWWLTIAPPAGVTGLRDDNPGMETLRNSGDRGTPSRIPELQPVSKNAPPTGTNTSGSTNDSGSSNTDSSVRNSSSNSGSSGSGQSSGSTRNSNGGRSSGGRR